MDVPVKLFAVFRERAGMPEFRVAWRPGITCADVIASFKSEFPDLATVLENSLVAVNGRHAEPRSLVGREDEMAILPPVSGG